MDKQQTAQQPIVIQQAVRHDLDAVRKPTNKKVQIVYLVVKTKVGNAATQPGERLSLPVSMAKAGIASGAVLALTGPVNSADVADAGGVDAYLEKNPKERLMPKAQEAQLRAEFKPILWKDPLPVDEQIQ